MNPFFGLLLCLLASFTRLLAQGPGEKLDQFGQQHPIEKVYLHLDRDDYIAGQTIWLKAYLYSDFLPSDKSTVVYVELLNASSTTLSRQTLPVFRAVTQGQIELPDTLTTGKYILRAYTATQLNTDSAFIYKRSIAIAGKQGKPNTVSNSSKGIRLEFFPEGGNFVAGQPNTIAFKATDETGLPVAVTARLMNSKDQTMAEFSSVHDGMGMFDVEAQANERYYVIVKEDVTGQKYSLPEAITRGVVFRLLYARDGVHFEIFQQKGDPIFEAAYMIGQMQHHTVFKQPLKAGMTSLSGVINTSKLSSGILHITVFNKDGMPLAERLTFVNNKEYLREATLITDTLDVSARGKNHFTLAFKDTVTGSFSVSVTDPLYSSAIREETIVSRLLLTSDLKGYIHNPAWYFSADDDSAKTGLDLLMMTNGWRRFKWEQLLKNPLQNGQYKDPAFATLSGRIIIEGGRKPFADKDFMVYIIAADSSRSMRLARTDQNGYYEIDSLIFFEKTKVMISDIRGKKSLFIKVNPGADSLNRFYPLAPVDRKDFVWTMQQSAEENKRKLAAYEAIIKANGLVLSEVVVRAKKKTPLEELDDKYTTGSFSGDARKTFDLVNSDDAKYYNDIWQFLQAKGFTGQRNSMPTISSMGNLSTEYYLDEFLTDPEMLDAIPMNKIALIKIYSTFAGSWGNGAGGVVAIYTKKDADLWSTIPSTGVVFNYNGFSVIKEFYSPDYSRPQPKAEPDQRITLYWKPDIFVNGSNIKVPLIFYNNERTRQFKVVVEGMTTDGKMVIIEKNLSSKPF